MDIHNRIMDMRNWVLDIHKLRISDLLGYPHSPTSDHKWIAQNQAFYQQTQLMH